MYVYKTECFEAVLRRSSFCEARFQFSHRSQGEEEAGWLAGGGRQGRARGDPHRPPAPLRQPRHPPLVPLGVLQQVVRPDERPLADCADKLALASVGALVSGELVTAREYFVAVWKGAIERLFSCVHPKYIGNSVNFLILIILI